MIFIGQYDELYPNKGYPKMADFFQKDAYKGKANIIYYLRHGEAFIASTETVKDVFTGKIICGGGVGRRDEEYAWTDDLAYYIDKYNLRLPKEIEDYILNKMKIRLHG